MTIRDDATPEELERWYRRTPQEIEAEKQARWNQEWAALRLPDDQAYQPETLSGGAGSDTLAGGAGSDRITPRHGAYLAPKIDRLAPHQHALLDTLAGTEAPGYDSLYTPKGQRLRHIALGPDGQTDYRGHPNAPAIISSGPNKGRLSSAAGRYQFIKGTWDNLTRTHDDLTDFSPTNQDKGAWYAAWERYARESGGRDLDQDLRDPKRYGDITRILHKEWTSLPGGIEQGQGQSEFDRRMAEGLRRYGAAAP
jgi:muramidase (phage lysozyme)